MCFPPPLHDFQTVKAIEQFGAVVEDLLMKHGKKIIGECVCVCVCVCLHV